MARRLTITDVVSLLGIGMICLPLFFLLGPNIEASRTEARISMAYIDVLELRESMANIEVTGAMRTLEDLDPWGQPYRLVRIDRQQVRVLSSGPNTSFSPESVDDDDIYSDMAASPIKAISDRKRRELFIALTATMGCWGLLGWLYVRKRRVSPTRPPTPHAPQSSLARIA
ncbi:MAG: hypothetical protein IH991_23220 [Planctomycetes bacterium]|nr:hypothetical protein [Planctomycetota bacterium]